MLKLLMLSVYQVTTECPRSIFGLANSEASYCLPMVGTFLLPSVPLKHKYMQSLESH